MSLLDRLSRIIARLRGRRPGHADPHVVADAGPRDDRSLNSSHFDDVDYEPVNDEE